MNALAFFARTVGAAALAALPAGCESPEPQFTGNVYSRVHADFMSPGTHRLAQVIDLATVDTMRRFRLGTKPESTAYESLVASGVPADTITDGSMAAGIVFCCGGGITKETVVVFHVPPGTPVAVGDVVEVEVGESPDLGPAARPNRAVAVRARAGDAACSWQPDDPGLWGRVLHCRGIEAEGWVRQTNYRDLWIRPPV